MLVAIILGAWVCSSTVFCLALLGAARSIPQGDEAIVTAEEKPSGLGLPQPLAAHCAAH
jgi:hypothetical protein